MPATTYSARQVFHPAIHNNYLRDRRRGAYAHIVSFNAVEYQQAQEQFDYIQGIRAIVFKAKDVLLDIWQRSAHW